MFITKYSIFFLYSWGGVSPSPLTPWHPALAMNDTGMNVQHWQNHNQQRETEVRGEKICINAKNLTQTALDPHPVLHSEMVTKGHSYSTTHSSHVYKFGAILLGKS
jgi:hypothetical protein